MRIWLVIDQMAKKMRNNVRHSANVEFAFCYKSQIVSENNLGRGIGFQNQNMLLL